MALSVDVLTISRHVTVKELKALISTLPDGVCIDIEQVTNSDLRLTISYNETEAANAR